MVVSLKCDIESSGARINRISEKLLIECSLHNKNDAIVWHLVDSTGDCKLSIDPNCKCKKYLMKKNNMEEYYIVDNDKYSVFGSSLIGTYYYYNANIYKGNKYIACLKLPIFSNPKVILIDDINIKYTLFDDINIAKVYFEIGET